MTNVPIIRTITLGLAEPHPLRPEILEHAARHLEQVRQHYEQRGYEVQTVRLSTRPLLEDLAEWSNQAILRYTHDLQKRLTQFGLGYCSLGPAPAYQPKISLQRLDLIAEILIETESISMTAQIASGEHGIRFEAALPIARIMQRLANETEGGEGNFRFALLAHVGPGIPFFPAAYHRGPDGLSVGLQGASIIEDALSRDPQEAMLPLDSIRARSKRALEEQAGPIVRLGQEFADSLHLQFEGIDLSPAPMGEVSIARALEMCGYGRIGEPGTLAVAAAITGALRENNLPTCGYNGLMLPVLEDALLGKRWGEGGINAYQLLLYSSVCGTGLDTLPLPGNIADERIAALLLDVAVLADRWRKPLSARLFPVPGKVAGEYTSFASPYLTNTRIQNI